MDKCRTKIPPTLYAKATKAILNGLTIEEASHHYQINVKTLKNHIGRKRSSYEMLRHTSKKLKLDSKLREVINEEEKVCIFCQHPEEREIELGKFHIKSKVSVHYYCLLFSCALEQNGEDDEGILGFLQKDILKEVHRGRKLKCAFCQKNGATIGCSERYCKASFHFPCGLDHHAQYLFSGDFRSYCSNHRDYQKNIKIPKADCPICLDPVTQNTKLEIYTPCCKKSWFHKLCLQKLALSAGYFFKCPLCNDKTIFVKEMLKLGVYVPEQDASWEKDPNAFADLLERPIHCDAPKCFCSQGRDVDDEGTIWEIVLCSLCGSTGTHLKCAKRTLKTVTWECSQCIEMLRKSNKQNSYKNNTFYPRKKKSRSRNNIGEFSGISNSPSSEPASKACVKTTLPSVIDMVQFASNPPENLWDESLQHSFKDIVSNCKLNIFSHTLDFFRSKSLREIQMLLLFQIYKPLSSWFDLKIKCANDMDEATNSSVNEKMNNLAKIIQYRIEEAEKSSIMEEFKILEDSTQGNPPVQIIRYGNHHFSLNAVDKDNQKVLFSLIKDCSVLLKPLSSRQIEQNVVLPSSPKVSRRRTRKTIIRHKSIRSYIQYESVQSNISDVKENISVKLFPSISPKPKCRSLPLVEKCLNSDTEWSPSTVELLPHKIVAISARNKKKPKQHPTDSKKYIQLSISDFFNKK